MREELLARVGAEPMLVALQAAQQLVRYLTMASWWVGGLRGVVDEDLIWVVHDLLVEQRAVLVRAVQELIDRWQSGALTGEEATRAIDSVAAEIARRIERGLDRT